MSARGVAGRLADQEGFTLVEVLVAALLITVALGGLLTAFDAAAKTSLEAQRHEQAVSIGQREIERLKSLDYRTQLGLEAFPAPSAADGNGAGDPSPANPRDPNFYVSGTNLKIMADLANKDSGLQAGVSPNPEPLDGPGDPELTDPRVIAGPESFSNGPTKGTIHRYVTWRNERCAPVTILGASLADPCREASDASGNYDSKRITVAVVLDPAANGSGPRKPVWVSSVRTDPRATPLGVDVPTTANPGSGPAITAQPFFLYDTPCSSSSRQEIGGSHETHDTARAPQGQATSCAAGPVADLMGPDAPPAGAAPPPMYDFSSDLARTPAAGLALKRHSTSCPTSYSAADAATLKWSIHTWATPGLTPAFVIPPAGRAALSFWTRTVGGQPADGTLCVTLRSALTGAVVASDTYTDSTWPASATRITKVLEAPVGADLELDDRLLLTLSVRSTSGADIELLYDHPSHQSFLSVATTTPLP